MRIALVTTSYPANAGDPSGHFVRAEAQELERAGHEVAVVAPRAGGPRGAGGGAFGWPGVAARLRENPARLADAAAWIATARGQVARLDLERVVAHWAVPCAWPVGVAARAGIEVVSHGGDVRLLVAMPRPLREGIVGAIARRAITWRFVSETLAEQLLAALRGSLHARVERIARIRPAAMDIPDMSHAAARVAREVARIQGGGEGRYRRRVAVSVGRLVASKRVDCAIEHMARTREAHVLVVVGDGPERARLQALARSRGIDVRFMGVLPRDEALAWIRAADVLLFASEAEGASTVLREARAMGTEVRDLRRACLQRHARPRADRFGGA